MKYHKRTKIVCTIGPASEKPEILRKLIRAGMNVARLNFSHGTHANHRQLFRHIHTASRAVGMPVAVLQDLQGPRIRLGDLPKDGVVVKRGQAVVFHYGASIASIARGTSLPLVFPLYRSVKKGSEILVDDGKLTFRVDRVHGKDIFTTVLSGGLVRAHKGVNTPGASISAPAMTAKDKEDLRFGLQLGVDFVTLSFVKRARDMEQLRSFVKTVRSRKSTPKLVAKIERPEAVRNIDRILDVSDAIMIGRGDLALETPPEDLLIIQKDIIAKCVARGVPVIVATQMLESMTENSRPTRAEISDVGNAVIDHTDATMLSGETAGGKYPVEACTMMRRIIEEVEASRYDDVPLNVRALQEMEERLFAPIEVQALCAALMAQGGDIAAIVCTDVSFLPSVARYRPELPLIPLVSDAHVARRQLLYWGVSPLVMRTPKTITTAWLRSLRRSIQALKIPVKGKRKQFALLTKKALTVHAL